jgi:hypothetical protein
MTLLFWCFAFGVGGGVGLFSGQEKAAREGGLYMVTL